MHSLPSLISNLEASRALSPLLHSSDLFPPTGLDKSYQAHAQSIEQLAQMMHSQRNSCVPASSAPCAACAVSCPAHFCGSPALRSAARRGAEHRRCGAGVAHTRCCMDSCAVCVCGECIAPVRPVPPSPPAPCPPSLALRSAARGVAEHRAAGQGWRTLRAAWIPVPSACGPRPLTLLVPPPCVVPSSSPLPRAHPHCAPRSTAGRTARHSDAAPPIRNVQTRSAHVSHAELVRNALHASVGPKEQALMRVSPLRVRAVVLSNLSRIQS